MVPTGNGSEVAEQPDVTVCSGCGQPFERRLFTTSWWACHSCDGTTGHRMYYCLRDGCRAVTADPPHIGQVGPTADLG